jgi:hypothetical protein
MNQTNAAVILPLHDPSGRLFELIWEYLPELKTIYSRAFVSLSPATETLQIDNISRLQADPFFMLVKNIPGTLCGDHFLAGYTLAVNNISPDTMLHSCDLDKIAHTLSGKHRGTYLADIQWANHQRAPVLFQRSETAWKTFPEHYRTIEYFAIDTGKLLFNKYYDFACSHFAMPAQTLQQLLPGVKGHGFEILLEIILAVREQLITKNVDWLEWEDPFVLQVDANTLREQRDRDPQEYKKRLVYIIPFLQILYEKIDHLTTS